MTFLARLIAAARRLLMDSMLPERGDTPNRRAALASGHIVIGAALGCAVTWALALGGLNWHLWAALPAAAIYAAAKEAGDLIRGGSPRDSMSDIGFVLVGACAGVYLPVWVAPFFALAILLDQMGFKSGVGQ